MIDWKAVQKCAAYAAIAHQGQFRKDGKTPFIVHPARVALLTYSSINDEVASTEGICTGWVHDVIEDCCEDALGFNIRNHTVSFREYLLENVPYEIATNIINMVIDLTKHTDPDASKEQIHKKYYECLAERGGRVTQVIKFCDCTDNLLDMNNMTPKGRRWYIRDTKQLIKILGSKVKSVDENIYNLLIDTLKAKEEEFKRIA
jgi:(p)ppGpp synthase/HD superfamily hydrolase